MQPWLIWAKWTQLKGVLCTVADELENMGCTDIAVVTATEFSVFGSHVPCSRGGSVVRVRAVEEGLGLGQPGRRLTYETWLEDAFKSSVGCCLVGSAHKHLQTCGGES